MDNFDLKKYLAEGRLLKEEKTYDIYGDGDVVIDISKATPEQERLIRWESDPKNEISEFEDSEAAQKFADEIMNLNSAKEVKNYYDNVRGWATVDYLDTYKAVNAFVGNKPIPENKLVKEDVSSRFIKKYLSMGSPEVFEDIEDIESYSDRDKAILIFLDEEHGVTISDELAKGIKDKSSADIIKYFQDEDYEYMSYGVMRRQLGVPVATGFAWNESGGTVGSRSVDAEDWYIDSSIVRKLNKIWREKYPELNIPEFNDSNYNLIIKVAQELDDYYRGQARKQKGIDLEVPYEEYAAMWVQALKDKDAIK